MKFQMGAMTVGDILDRGMKMLFARLPAFYVIALIVNLPLLAVQLGVPLVQLGEFADPTDYAALMAPTIVLLVLIFFLAPFGTAASLRIIGQEFTDEPISLGEALKDAARCFLPLLGTSILVGLAVFAGVFLCFVGAIVFSVWFAFAGQVVVMEGISGGAALGRSKDLTEGYRWRIFGVTILIGFISGVLGITAVLLNLVLPGTETVRVQSGGFTLTRTVVVNYPNYAINITVAFLLQALAQSYGYICMTLLYFDTRIRKEGFDLEVAASRFGKPQAAGPETE
jgi:hypothetical protein